MGNVKWHSFDENLHSEDFLWKAISSTEMHSAMTPGVHRITGEFQRGWGASASAMVFLGADDDGEFGDRKKRAAQNGNLCKSGNLEL